MNGYLVQLRGSDGYRCYFSQREWEVDTIVWLCRRLTVVMCVPVDGDARYHLPLL